MNDTTESRDDLLKRVLMTQQAIADATGYSQQAISMILNGDRMPSPEKAIKLEKATGVCREGWIWPERHFNPYIPFTGSEMCLTCPNRIHRMEKTIGTILSWLSSARTQIEKDQALKEVAPIIHACHGFTKHQTVTFREITPKGGSMLSHAGTFALPQFVTNHMMPWAAKKLRAGETIHVPYFPYDLPPEAKLERVLGKGVGLRSILAVSSGKHLIIFASLRGKLMEWTPEMIERLEWFIKELSRLLEADTIEQDKSV